MPSFHPMKFVLDSDNGLSSAMGTDSLTAHNLVLEGREDTPSQRRLIHGRRYLGVDQNSFPVFDNGHSTTNPAWKPLANAKGSSAVSKSSYARKERPRRWPYKGAGVFEGVIGPWIMYGTKRVKCMMQLYSTVQSI